MMPIERAAEAMTRKWDFDSRYPRRRHCIGRGVGGGRPLVLHLYSISTGESTTLAGQVWFGVFRFLVSGTSSSGVDSVLGVHRSSGVSAHNPGWKTRLLSATR